MLTECKLELVNDHIVMNNGQRILLDTGSPMSFHHSGVLTFGENRFEVSTEIPGVSSQYLSEKVGCEINGILGMDVINQIPITISLEDGLFFLDDETDYPCCFQRYPLSPLAGGLLAVTLSVNGHKANMIVDTGAYISYIRSEYISGLTSHATKNDFSPFFGDFQTEIYKCDVDSLTGHEVYAQDFGTPPQNISMTLSLLNVDGVIGVDLFKRFRLQIKDGVIKTKKDLFDLS